MKRPNDKWVSAYSYSNESSEIPAPVQKWWKSQHSECEGCGCEYAVDFMRIEKHGEWWIVATVVGEHRDYQIVVSAFRADETKLRRSTVTTEQHLLPWLVTVMRHPEINGTAWKLIRRAKAAIDQVWSDHKKPFPGDFVGWGCICDH